MTGLKIGEASKKHFGIGLGAGYSFDGFRIRPGINVSLQYSVIRF
jgi:hypothetical protein